MTDEGGADKARDVRRPATSRRSTVLVAVACVLALFALAHRLGWLERFGEPAKLASTLVGLGPWGYLVFVTAYAALQPFGVPGTVFIVAAPLIWPWPVAFALSMTGTMAASVVGFSFARFVARDWVARRIPARFAKYDEALAARGFATVFFLRFVFWMPPLLHAFFGVSKVRFWTHVWGSLAGYVVPLFVVSYFGAAIFELARAAPRAWLVPGAALLLVTAAVLILRARRAAARRRADAPARG
ncbi:MAG: VTT domain-containing protein [Deltaproteobacteria bacterium]|nr:VTT domain-containing protein [Deltaproteobacteria bacterium]